VNVLEPGELALVRVSAAVAAWSQGSAKPEDVAWTLRIAEEEASQEAVEETLLQSYLFLGYPAALNALGLWRKVSEQEAGTPHPWDPSGWEERGEGVCRTVYGGQYEGLRDNVRELHADMERWMVVEGYGKVLGRPGLELRVRELCIVALLAVTGWPTQLYSHLRGALHAGATEEEVGEALEVALALAEDGPCRKARTTWARIRNRGEDG
jgi:4-carboxymuconolactone decarboxylase